MKVIWFNGNLGNQIFNCKYIEYLKLKYPNEHIYGYFDKKCPPITVNKYFNIELPETKWFVYLLSFVVFKILGVFFRRIPPNYVPSFYCGCGKLNDEATFIANSMQMKYFYCDNSSEWLQIKMPEKLSEEYLKYERLIKESNSVCVHLRRGDYIKPESAYVDLSSTDYYTKAIAQAKEWYPDYKLFFFSDDLSFVKGKFGEVGIYYVDCNKGENSFLDIKLMSFAKVNIMANSTFSYWAGYINNENKKIIYPRLWFAGYAQLETPDIMLENWIGI